MKKALQCLVLFLTALSPAFASTRVIPVAGHLPGVNDTTWATNVSLHNDDAAATNVDLVFHGDDGLTRTRSITLGGSASVLLEDALDPSKFGGSNPASWIGQLEVRAA